MNMKNTKAIFLIIFGAFIMATGFAFASDPYSGDAYNTLKNGPFAKSALGDLGVSASPGIKPPAGPDITFTPTAKPQTTTPPEVRVSSDTPKPPTLGESISKFVGKNRSVIFGTAIAAYLGMALFAAPLLGALIGFALFKYF